MAKKSTRRSRSPKSDYQVFVSHATADKWLATTLCEKIEESGATTFRDDRDIDGGDDIPDEIRRQIKRSRELLLLLTPESIDRPWVLFEAGAAWGWSQKMLIVPILYHVGADPIPAMIKAKKAISLNEFDNYLHELAKRIKRQK